MVLRNYLFLPACGISRKRPRLVTGGGAGFEASTLNRLLAVMVTSSMITIIVVAIVYRTLFIRLYFIAIALGHSSTQLAMDSPYLHTPPS